MMNIIVCLWPFLSTLFIYVHAEVVSVYEGTSAVLECPGPGSIINWYQIPDPITTPLSSSEEIRDYYLGENADPSDYRAYYFRSNSNSGNVDRDGTYTIPNITNDHDGLWYKCLRGPGIPIQLEVIVRQPVFEDDTSSDVWYAAASSEVVKRIVFSRIRPVLSEGEIDCVYNTMPVNVSLNSTTSNPDRTTFTQTCDLTFTATDSDQNITCTFRDINSYHHITYAYPPAGQPVVALSASNTSLFCITQDDFTAGVPTGSYRWTKDDSDMTFDMQEIPLDQVSNNGGGESSAGLYQCTLYNDYGHATLAEPFNYTVNVPQQIASTTTAGTFSEVHDDEGTSTDRPEQVKDAGFKHWWIFVIIGAAVLLVVIVGIVYYCKRSSQICTSNGGKSI